jgi:peptidoglycan/LPS O-acetylase OafA/YrhL
MAAMMVLATHWAPVLGWQNAFTDFAFSGVDVFFVISGFVFAPYCLGERRPPLAAYALRRSLRIYPAYLVALGVYVALAHHQGRPLLYLGEHLLMAHVQTREMAFYYSAPFWSLPSEVEFYLLVPLLGALVHAGTQRLSAGAVGVAWATLLVGALGLRGVLTAQADAGTQNFAYVGLHHLPGLLIEFLLGVWAWQLHRRSVAGSWPAWRHSALAICGLLGALACVLAYQALERGPAGPNWRHGQLGLGMAVAFALVLAATAGMAVRGRVAQAACAWSGRMSYAVYLLHMAWVPALQSWVHGYGAATAAGLAALGLAVSAWLLHRVVEEPLRQWARRKAKAWEDSAAVGGDQKTSVSPG